MKTLVYRYQAKALLSGAERVEANMRASHRLYNDLVAIERGRRLAVREICGSDDAEAEALAAEIEQVSADIEALAQVVKDKRQRARAKAETAADRERLAAAKARRVGLRERRREVIGRRLEDPGVVAMLAAVQENAGVLKRAARSICPAHWGTYELYEAAADQAARTAEAPEGPRFSRWDGGGMIGARHKSDAPMVSDSGGCETSVIRVERVEDRSRGRSWAHVSLRVGTDGRDPIWATWRVNMHRPLPPEALIVSAKAKREIVALKDRWWMCVTIRMPDGHVTEPCGVGAVAVDIGWRKRRESPMRVGWIYGEHGDDEEVSLDPRVTGEIARIEGVRSVRDRAMDRIRRDLVRWGHAASSAGVAPQWWLEATRWLGQSRSHRRFQRLEESWRGQRFARDGRMYERLRAWSHHDKHLWSWEANGREQAMARRKEQYRLLGVRLARKYGVLVLERFVLSKIARLPEPDSAETRGDTAKARGQRVEAATGELRECLKQAFQARGGRVVLVPAQRTTKDCSRCGAEMIGDAAASVSLRCPTHGIVDQDQDAARSILARYDAMRGDLVEVGAARDATSDDVALEIRAKKHERGGAWAKRRAGKRGGARDAVAGSAGE